MSLTPKEQFRFALLLDCANQGLPIEQVRTLVKEAREKVADFGGTAAGTMVGNTIGKLPSAAGSLMKYLAALPINIGALGLGAAAGTGLATGYLGAKITEEDVNPDEAKKQELMAAYRQQAERARRSSARVSYRPNQQKVRAPSMF